LIFLDTSVIVAAASRADPRHRASLDRLSSSTRKDASCALHSLAEVFSVVTGAPHPLRIPVSAALTLVEQTRDRVKTIALSEDEYFAVVQESARAGRIGGIIFDALLLACARKAKAETIYTWNVRHFRLIAPDLASRILEPGS
jgi:predicted nucleic acid-binding protein